MFNRNLDAFEARIKRLAAQEAGNHKLIAGEGDLRETQISPSALKRAAKRSKRPSGTLILALPNWALAFVIGAVAMLAGRLAGFHVLGQFMAGGDMTMVIMRHAGELAVGFVVLIAAATVIGFRGGVAKSALMAGFAMMVLAEADLAGQMPVLWESLFSPEYTARVLGQTGNMANNLRAFAGALQSSI